MDDLSVEREWSGRVPKPGTVLVLQALGGLCALFGVGFLALGAALDFEEMAKIWAFVASVCFVVAPFALLSGWSRPPGLVAGLVALSIMLVLVPVGTFIASVIGFFAIKNKDHIRDYYSQPKR